jgi:uncharacterized protein CbrC (UPF0167 family)
MRRVNTRGIKQANKCILMAAIAYNLKKLLKWEQTKVETAVMTMRKAGKSLAFYFFTLLHCRQLHNCTQPIFLLSPIPMGK